MYVCCAGCGELLGSGDGEDPEHMEAARETAEDVNDAGCPFCGSREYGVIFDDAGNEVE